MKRLFTLWVVLFVVLSAMAVPAKPGVWRTISLTDGTQVKVQLVGDEFMHYYQSADGTRYLYDAASATYQVYYDSQFSNSRRKAVARRAKANNRRAVRRKANVTNIFQGTKKGLIILAQFTDSKFQSGHDRALYNKIANAENYTDNGFKGSVKDYFKAQSAGQFELDFDVVGICPLKNPCSYYGGNDAYTGDDLHAGEMVAEACQWAATQGVDFSKYDWDGDGEVDQVFVLYAGKGEADGGAESTVWPHEYALSESDYGKSLSFNGVKVDTYACSAELNGRGKLGGIGTFCHEFSHCMGFPDLYDTSYSGWFGMGDYDLMSAGNYNGDSKCPAGYSAYEKHKCGWLTYQDVTNIEEDLNVTGLKAISEGGGAYVLKNKAHEDEYYIIENRQKTGWDAYLPSDGVMITHVDYDAYIWLYNTPNAQDKYYDENDNVYYNDHQRLTIFRAGRSASDDGVTSDLYPYNTNNSLTAESNPAATLYNKNSDGTKYMHVDITDISVASDGTASLTFSKADRSSGGGGETDPDTPVTPSGSVLLYESFDKCDGTGGNDDKWNGNIAGSSTIAAEYDNQGWTSTGKIYSGYECVRLGNSSTAGIITTPAFSVNGSAYLSFKAGGWDGTNDATTLTLSVNNGTLSKTTVTIPKGSWNQFGVTITATGTVKVTFKADKQRFFLDEVKVVDPTINSGIHDIVAGEENGIVAYYSLNGTRLNGPRSGVCIVRYANGEVRKVIIR
jgi:hypothetical protein